MYSSGFGNGLAPNPDKPELKIEDSFENIQSFEDGEKPLWRFPIVLVKNVTI